MTDFGPLLQRLENFEFDSPDATFSFSDRLARENRWSHEYTRRVLVEYKRFAYLAIASGHPVSPPEDVDQAWHLHLTYSENYWKIFCPEILGQPLHHAPGKGGLADREKFQSWYAQTCDSYHKHFGNKPPNDIWPSPEAKRAVRHQYRRIDLARHWVLPKPRFTSIANTLLALAAVPLAVLCIGATPGKGGNIFEWSGLDFIFLYLAIATVAIMAAVLLRYQLRHPHAPRPLEIPSLDPYAIAYLNGGEGLVVDAALANLIRQKAVHLDARKHILTPTGIAPEFARQIERRVYSAIQEKGSKLKYVRSAAKASVEKVVEHLQSIGLLMSRATALKATIVPYGLIAVLIAIGVVKIAVGVGRGKPVGFLILACFLTIIGIAIWAARQTDRSRYGDAVLAALQDKHLGQARLGKKTSEIAAPEFLMTLGLFGMSALALTDLDHLRKSLAPPGNDGGGGSTCGGGDSGGGGGGGCGGCGGD